MRKSNTLIPINVDYLKEVVTNSGKTVVSFCESIGRSSSTYYNAISRGECQEIILKTIASIYKCDYNKLVLPDPEPIKPEPAEALKEIESTSNIGNDIEYIKQMVYCIMESNDRIAKFTQELKSMIADFLAN